MATSGDNNDGCNSSSLIQITFKSAKCDICELKQRSSIFRCKNCARQICASCISSPKAGKHILLSIPPVRDDLAQLQRHGTDNGPVRSSGNEGRHLGLSPLSKQNNLGHDLRERQTDVPYLTSSERGFSNISLNDKTTNQNQDAAEVASSQVERETMAETVPQPVLDHLSRPEGHNYQIQRVTINQINDQQEKELLIPHTIRQDQTNTVGTQGHNNNMQQNANLLHSNSSISGHHALAGTRQGREITWCDEQGLGYSYYAYRTGRGRYLPLPFGVPISSDPEPNVSNLQERNPNALLLDENTRASWQFSHQRNNNMVSNRFGPMIGERQAMDGTSIYPKSDRVSSLNFSAGSHPEHIQQVSPLYHEQPHAEVLGTCSETKALSSDASVFPALGMPVLNIDNRGLCVPRVLSASHYYHQQPTGHHQQYETHTGAAGVQIAPRPVEAPCPAPETTPTRGRLKTPKMGYFVAGRIQSLTNAVPAKSSPPEGLVEDIPRDASWTTKELFRAKDPYRWDGYGVDLILGAAQFKIARVGNWMQTPTKYA